VGYNHTHVSRGFRILLGALAPYLAREFRTEFGKDWWNTAVIGNAMGRAKTRFTTFWGMERTC